MDKSWYPPNTPPNSHDRLPMAQNASSRFHIMKMGPTITESEVTSELRQFGDIINIQESRDSTQNFQVELKLHPSKTVDQVLSHINNNFKQNGWSISEAQRTAGYDQQMPRPTYPPNAMPHHTGLAPENNRAAYYYHAMQPGAQRPGYSYGYGMPTHPQGMMGFSQNMRMMGAAPLRPPPPPMPAAGQSSHLYPMQAVPHNNFQPGAPQVVSAGVLPTLVPQKQPEDRVDITPDMIANLKALKNPDKMMDLLRLDPEVVQKLVLGLTNNNKLSLVVHNIKVREIWVGNLTEDTTKTQIEDAFTKYGDIENIEIFNKPTQIFAFLKYKKVKQAAAAFENIDNLSLAMRLSLKISYADFSKRNSVVGDNAFLEDNEDDLTPYLFMAYNSGLNLPSSKRLQKKMSEFGNVKGILLKPSYDSNYKSFVIVEFETAEQAIKARRYYFLADKSNKRRQKLGAKDIDINILTKVPEMRKFELTNQMVKSSSSSNKLSGHPAGRGKSVAESLKEIFKVEEEPKKAPKAPSPGGTKIQEEEPVPKETVPDPIMVENEKLTNTYELCWSGTVYKGKNNHFLCDVLCVEGDAEPLKALAERLIVTHKTSVREALSKRRLATAVILPSNQASYKEFLFNLAMFRDEEIAGVTLDPPKSKVFGTISATRQSIVYIIPYTDRVKEHFPADADPNAFLMVIAEKGDLELDVVYSKISTEDVPVAGALDDVKDKVIKRHENHTKDESLEETSSSSSQEDEEDMYSNVDNDSHLDSNGPASPIGRD